MAVSRLGILLLIAAGCARTELDGSPLVDAPVAGSGGALTSSSSGAASYGGDGAGRGGGGAGTDQGGGRAGLGGTAAAGAGVDGGASGAGRGGAAAGAGGAPAPANDPTTIGDERPGSMECTDGVHVVICQAPQLCCDGRCIFAANQCAPALLAVCDGDEDCPASQHCCRPDKNSSSITCRSTCLQGTIRHLACGGSCRDSDGDHIPNGVDACIFTEFEDGKSPLSEDGCSDFDGDGIHDGIDQCPTQLENGQPPKPSDGCP